jgi:ABC-type transport system involved in multi-copper enzyme maturation permease subunit
MSKVTIEVNSKWVKIVRSPLYWIVTALQGVSITFAPLFLYWSGKGLFSPGENRYVVPLCFVTIFFVGIFYMLLGSQVIGELRKSPREEHLGSKSC